MKITDIRTRVVEWRGPTVPPQPHFCTNPMDLIEPMLQASATTKDSMAGFRFHGWLIVEMFTDAGLVGIGNAALAPRLTKQTIDLYLKPLLIGSESVRRRVSLAADVPQDDGVRPEGRSA